MTEIVRNFARATKECFAKPVHHLGQCLMASGLTAGMSGLYVTDRLFESYKCFVNSDENLHYIYDALVRGRDTLYSLAYEYDSELLVQLGNDLPNYIATAFDMHISLLGCITPLLSYVFVAPAINLLISGGQITVRALASKKSLLGHFRAVGLELWKGRAKVPAYYRVPDILSTLSDYYLMKKFDDQKLDGIIIHTKLLQSDIQDIIGAWSKYEVPIRTLVCDKGINVAHTVSATGIYPDVSRKILFNGDVSETYSDSALGICNSRGIFVGCYAHFPDKKHGPEDLNFNRNTICSGLWKRSGIHIKDTFHHEFGHMIDRTSLTQNSRNVSYSDTESFKRAYRNDRRITFGLFNRVGNRRDIDANRGEAFADQWGSCIAPSLVSLLHILLHPHTYLWMRRFLKDFRQEAARYDGIEVRGAGQAQGLELRKELIRDRLFEKYDKPQSGWFGLMTENMFDWSKIRPVLPRPKKLNVDVLFK